MPQTVAKRLGKNGSFEGNAWGVTHTRFAQGCILRQLRAGSLIGANPPSASAEPAGHRLSLGSARSIPSEGSSCCPGNPDSINTTASERMRQVTTRGRVHRLRVELQSWKSLGGREKQSVAECVRNWPTPRMNRVEAWPQS